MLFCQLEVKMAHNKWANNALEHKSMFYYYSGIIKMLFDQLDVKVTQSVCSSFPKNSQLTIC